MDDLEGRVAVVTGAASGIGRALAVRLAGEGMRLVVADVEASALADTRTVVSEVGAEVLAVLTDVADGGAVGDLAAQAYERFGAVHLLCNNAGVFQGGLVWETTDEDWRWVLGVNLHGMIHGIRSFVPRMLAGGAPGHVLNTASMAAFFAAPWSGPYCVSKHAAYALSETLAHDLRAVGAPIGVSVLCPSAVASGIGHSRRNRPADLAGALTESAAFVEQALVDTVSAGLAPDTVAGIAVEAVRRGDFLVPTRPSYAEQIGLRSHALVDRRLPEVPDID